MRIDRILKNMLQHMFQKKNFKYFIIIVCLSIMLFLIYGNYNLIIKEGLTLLEQQQKNNRNIKKALETGDKYKGIEEHYAEAKNIEGMTCGNENYSSVYSGANNAVNKMCNITKKTCQENGNC